MGAGAAKAAPTAAATASEALAAAAAAAAAARSPAARHAAAARAAAAAGRALPQRPAAAPSAAQAQAAQAAQAPPRRAAPRLFSYGDPQEGLTASAPASGDAAPGAAAGDAGAPAAADADADGPGGAASSAPLDSRAAEAQEQAAAARGVPAASVSVRRILSSGPGAADAAARERLHAKSELTVRNLEAAPGRAGAVRARADDGAGSRSFAVWEAMQVNPRLLDTPSALAQSSTAVAALRSLQLTGGAPSDAEAARIAARDAPRLLAAGGGAEGGDAGERRDRGAEAGAGAEAEAEAGVAAAAASPAAGSEAAAREAAAATGALLALAPLSVAQASALVPSGRALDAMLLAHDPTRGGTVALAPWGPRPSESGPFDQLVLRPAEDALALERNELFELFARHRADPRTWTAARLAAHYACREDWVEVLLEFVAPPVYARVDGDVYGVREIRSIEEFERIAEGRGGGSGGGGVGGGGGGGERSAAAAAAAGGAGGAQQA